MRIPRACLVAAPWLAHRPQGFARTPAGISPPRLHAHSDALAAASPHASCTRPGAGKHWCSRHPLFSCSHLPTCHRASAPASSTLHRRTTFSARCSPWWVPGEQPPGVACSLFARAHGSSRCSMRPHRSIVRVGSLSQRHISAPGAPSLGASRYVPAQTLRCLCSRA
jgi:hypothetical protein